MCMLFDSSNEKSTHLLLIENMAAARMSVLSAASAAVGITTLLLLVSHVESKANTVQVNLNAKWNSTPLLLEASEYLSKENEDYFWGFVEAISQKSPDSLKGESDESIYKLLLELASKFVSTLQLSMLKLSLSLRVHSPEVEMHDQMAKEDKLSMSSGEEKLTNCEAFVNIHGAMTCDVKEIDSLIKSAPTRVKASTFSFDHRYPSSAQTDVLVILYARLGTATSQTFHQRLKQLVMNKEIDYVFRHYIPNPVNQPVRLSGYGVELAIKSTEYKAKDDTKVEGEKTQSSEEDENWEKDIQGFNFNMLKDLHPELKPQLREFHNYLMDTATELTPLKVWQLQDLSLQAAAKALTAPPEEALNVLKIISQNFPVQARSLVRTTVPELIRKEITKNQKHFENYHNLSPGECAVYLNGIPIDIEVYDVYTLLDTMKSEAAVMEGLFSLGVTGESLNKLVKMDLKNNVEDYVLDFRHSAVEYINDLEKDVKYKRWPSSIQEMLRPTFPGMLRHIGKNIFHMVFVLDPAHPQSRDLLKIAEAFYVHSAPVRIGIVFAVNSSKEIDGRTDPGVAVARTFQYIKVDQDPASALSFITDLYEKGKSEEMTTDFIINEFSSRFNDEDLDKVFGDDDDYDDLRKLAADFVKKSGLSDFPQVLLNGVPLKKKYLNADLLEEAVVSEILHGTHEIQRAVYHGELTDNMNMLDWLMEKENVLPRINSRILSAPLMYLDLTENADKEIYSDPEAFAALSMKGMSSVIAQNMHYLARKDDASLRAVSIWIVADVESPKGREIVYTAIKNLRYSNHMRVGIIFNPPNLDQDNFITRAVHVAMSTLTGNMAKNFVTKLVKEDYVKSMKAGTKTLKDLEVNGMDIDQYMATLDKETGAFLKPHRAFVTRVLQLNPGVQAVIGNGKVIGPLGSDELFIQEDFSLLEKHLMQTAAKKIQAHVETMPFQGQMASDLIMKVSSLLSAKSLSKSRKEINFNSDTHSVVKIPADSNAPSFEMEIIMDPVSREAQKLVPILITLKEVANINIKIFMNSKDKLSELPLTNFYRYVLEPDVKFNADGSSKPGPIAEFENLPQKSLLTLNMHPPESWLVESVKSLYDLDNIMLEEAKNGVSADFELEYLLLEGHCHDSSSGQPPRGLQFTLGTNSTPVLVDTIVMANLGYFQLKAYPGVWLLSLREGRSREIYEILSHEMTDTPADSKDVIVAISSFKSKTIRIKVGKKSDKLHEELLKDEEDDDDESMGIWDSISTSFGGRKKEKKEEKDSTLNIFSLASGHLYERFLRIMMLSVLKNTKSKVKFWFLKNYLSPTFKDFIPHMAKEYGFEYELVQYKWPRWLNQQKEKQRVIWGYKILFLDVLFPLDVKKIIFVDADQIVRTDLQELYDLDLGGAPYGYTPFCSSRTEMDGFRFWKSGYWASHLGGRKYHISALYVVDLKKFRRIAAGDRLRGQYQGLSQDPNSLANLDQDLPNNMIHQVAIKSLPQEWLWCETWCSTEELGRAKTIDLCNNPLTKEPKLQAAMRIVPEWKDYDYEIKVVWDKIYKTNTRFQIEYEKPKKYRDVDDNRSTKPEEKKSKKKTEL